GTVVTVDETEYNATGLPVSFWWTNGTPHTFAFQSPLVVTPYAKQYVWNSGSNLSSLQSDSITVSTSGSITGNYKAQYYLTTSANFGTASLNSGWHDIGSTVQISASAPDAEDGERYVWLGWTGTGDGNYTGMDNLTIITINGPITERASWQHQYRLIMDTNFGTTEPSVGEHWYDVDSPIEINATAPTTTSGEQYVWLGWTETDNNSTDNPVSITMNGPITKTAVWRHEYYLTITSLYGSPTLESGWLEAEKNITASVTSPVLGPAGTRYVCTGWTGTESISTSGTTTSVAFTINASSSITWNWKTQYLLTARTDPVGIGPKPTTEPAGEIGLDGSWYDNGTPVNCTAQKIRGHAFSYWTVDGESWDPGDKKITITMNEPYEAIAYYALAPAWWEILLNVDMVNIYIGIVGFVALPIALIGIGWFRNRRKKTFIRTLLNEIDEVYSRLKTKPRRCKEELCRLRDKDFEVVIDGKIAQESYDIIDKRIEKYLEELRKRTRARG
ncbi:MAG: hypothetical protein JSV12_00200, partial [Candidatus Bathyarchaeota archaeon]